MGGPINQGSACRATCAGPSADTLSWVLLEGRLFCEWGSLKDDELRVDYAFAVSVEGKRDLP